jgi:membrane protease YdiL (CAAX protease family)
LSVIKKLVGEKLNINWKIAVLTIVSTLLITVSYYYQLTGSNYLDSLLLFIVIPVSITVFIFRESPAEYGFKLGNWRLGIPLTLLGCLGMVPIIWYLGSDNASMANYYQYSREGLIWKKALEMLGWEYLFRGWLLFGYAKKYGPDALWLQAVPFAIAHLGKPSIETFSTIFGGFAFGWLAWRTGSFLYSVIVHWFINILIVLISSGGL